MHTLVQWGIGLQRWHVGGVQSRYSTVFVVWLSLIMTPSSVTGTVQAKSSIEQSICTNNLLIFISPFSIIWMFAGVVGILSPVSFLVPLFTIKVTLASKIGSPFSSMTISISLVAIIVSTTVSTITTFIGFDVKILWILSWAIGLFMTNLAASKAHHIILCYCQYLLDVLLMKALHGLKG